MQNHKSIESPKQDITLLYAVPQVSALWPVSAVHAARRRGMSVHSWVHILSAITHPDWLAG